MACFNGRISTDIKLKFRYENNDFKKREHQQVFKLLLSLSKKNCIQVLTVNNKNIMIICCYDSHTGNFCVHKI